jgi:hypothetical protein
LSAVSHRHLLCIKRLRPRANSHDDPLAQCRVAAANCRWSYGETLCRGRIRRIAMLGYPSGTRRRLRSKGDINPPPSMSAMCHVWTAPSWQGVFSRSQAWSVQPCVRPICAVHMTAGHNALRGSGPGQQPAFNDAMAQVGCPDRRIDGSALRAVCPPNLHITPDSRRDLVYAASATGSR